MSKPASPRSRLLGVLWQTPLFALPFAAFFILVVTLIFGTQGGTHFRAYYVIALVFTGVIRLNLWALQVFGIPRLLAAFPKWRPTFISLGMLHMVVALVASVEAAGLLERFLFPGFLGSFRLVAVFGINTLIFAAFCTAVVLVWMYHERSIVHERAARDLELARQIQQSFLPNVFPSDPRLDIHAVNVPSRTVSGDFYDVVPANGAVLLAIGDVEGKGIPAALLTGMLQASMRTQMAEDSVAVIARNMNVLACRRSSTLQQFATFFLARLDAEGRLIYCNAGHNPPLLLRANGEPLPLERGGMMLGVLEQAPFQEETVALRRGDRLLLYTDGITERANPRGEELGTERLTSFVAALPPELSAAETIGRIVGEADRFAEGVEPGDDQTLMVVCVRA